ncbi:hypothetical protein [Sphingomonas oligophenolica]|uniref:hypothetical protein n=1 Tax=Sphingomonas oligophenolica TaxID=301154 RepID=UPI00112B64A2|nr:hypothetical protein [Sphingomonas oligophenolica]
MKRVSRETLRMRLIIGLQVRKPYERRELGLITVDVIERVVDDMLMRIMGRPESEALILQPSAAGPPLSPRIGVWGVDEPHPFPDMPFADH